MRKASNLGVQTFVRRQDSGGNAPWTYPDSRNGIAARAKSDTAVRSETKAEARAKAGH
jgi:hypothetical protein